MVTQQFPQAISRTSSRRLRRALGLGVLALALPAGAALSIPSDGSDGALTITANTTIDLSQAVTGTWDASNAANAGKGIYDAAKWAVVFKYTEITVAAGATVTFTNHPSRAPVVWLVSGNATIAGTVSLSGASYGASPVLAEPGPGGFRGGMAFYSAGVTGGAGLGPGGGTLGTDSRGHGAGHASTLGTTTGPVYGNPSLLPLVGGSGGGGDGNSTPAGGGAGGGALLLACGGTLTLSGAIRANGGAGRDYWQTDSFTGGGSGGGIRLVASTLTGSGVIEALGGGGYTAGGVGRVRIERVTNEGAAQVVPDPSVVALADGSTPVIWPPDDGPQVRIVSIGGEAVPADPRASFGAAGADATIAQTSSTAVVVETTNVEEAAQVFVRVTPRANGNYSRVQATSHEVVTADPLVIRWTATVPVLAGYSAVQVHVVRP